MIQRVCVLTPGYPTKEKPYAYTFTDQLVCAIADKGIEVTVVVPHDALKSRKVETDFWERKTPKGKVVKVYSSAAITLTTRKYGPINMSLLSEKMFLRAVQRVLKKQKIDPDILYAQFLFPAGTCAAALGEKLGIPSVLSFGESSLWSIREIGIEGARKRLSLINGVIAVSTHNKDVLCKNKLVDTEKITVIPNAVNKKVFLLGNKKNAREVLNLPQDKIIGIYNGAFSYSKGARRVEEASRGIKNLAMVYLGGGKEEPTGKNIIFKGRVAHKDVPLWLQAADFFVLPTLEEGCSNAVVEAMSTGLPIITSDKPFNYDILDHNSALLVDPLDINALKKAVQQMVESEELRERLGHASIRKSEELDINLRADRVITFLESIKQDFQKG